MVSSLGWRIRERSVLYFCLFITALALVLPMSFASAATSIGNNVSVGGTLTVTGLTTFTAGFLSNASSSLASSLNVSGNLNASSALFAAGLATINGGVISNASSSIASSLNVSGNLNVSSTLFVAGNILPEANNTRNLGAFGTAFANVYVSSSLVIGGNGSTVSSTPITAHLSMITTAINLADAATSTAKCTSSTVTFTCATLGDTVLVSPLTFDDAFVAGQLTAVPTAANTVAILY